MSNELKEEITKLAKIIFECIGSIKLKYYYKSVPKIKTRDYGYSLNYEEVPDYFITFYQNCNEHFQKLDLTELNNLFKKDYPFFKNYIKTRQGGGSSSPKDFLLVIIVSLFSKNTNQSNFDLLLFDELKGISDIFEKKKTFTRQYHPIKNLSYIEDLAEHKIQEGVLVKKLSDDEINNFIGMDSYFHKSNLDYYAIVFDYYEEIGFSEDETLNNPKLIQEIPNILELFLYSLNLTTKGGFLFNTVHTLHLDYFSHFSGMTTSSSYATDSPHNYRLNKEDFNNWCEKYNELSHLKLEHFKLALSRLSEAERRLNPIDSIIDSVIGLESILLNDIGNKKTQGELRFRFALNYASLFLKEDRYNKRKFANDIYDLRSSIVHGSQKLGQRININNKDYNLEMISGEINKMLRDTINHLIKLPANNNFYSDGYWIKKVLNL